MPAVLSFKPCRPLAESLPRPLPAPVAALWQLSTQLHAGPQARAPHSSRSPAPWSYWLWLLCPRLSNLLWRVLCPWPRLAYSSLSQNGFCHFARSVDQRSPWTMRGQATTSTPSRHTLHRGSRHRAKTHSKRWGSVRVALASAGQRGPGAHRSF
jgi:hypothetical protein